MAESRPNQVRYNDKISAIRREIRDEKVWLAENIKSRVLALLKRRSPVDTGDLKRSWIITLRDKHKLSGRSLSTLRTPQGISIGIEVRSTSRHAVMQMFGWKAVGGQLLTAKKSPDGKLDVLMASRPMFKPAQRRRRNVGGKKPRGESINPNGLFTFVTSRRMMKPNKDLAYNGGAHSIEAEIKRTVSALLKRCKYISHATFMSSDKGIASILSTNNVRGRIEKWMDGTLDVELNSKATMLSRSM